MASKNPHPHVAWRDGRPRFKPGPKLREQGYQGMDLRHPAGTRIQPADLEPGTKNAGEWFSKGEAVDWSAAFVKRLGAEKPPAPKPTPPARLKARYTPATAPRGSYPVSRLITDWKRSPVYLEDLADKSRRDYSQKMRTLETVAPDLWAAEADALDQPILYGLFDLLRREKGLATARGVLRVLSSAITWGLTRGKFRILKANPALKLKLKSTKPRVRFATRTELATLIAVADYVGRPELGDSFVLAVWSGQRQGDRLALRLKGRVNNRIVLRQCKTGAIVAIKEAPELVNRFSGAAERRKAAGVVSSHMILFEKTWTPWQEDTYRHYFGEVRRIGVNGLWQAEDGTLICPASEGFKHLKNVHSGPAAGTCLVEPCPSLHDFWEMDFRDTAVTWMGLAGAELPEICSVTGHSLQSATIVLRHYLARHPEMADSAISKMIAWYEDDGETELGL